MFSRPTVLCAPILAASSVLGMLAPAQASDLGLAKDYNLFLFEDIEARNSDIEGKAAVGGNAFFEGYSIGTNAANNGVPSLVVGNDLTFTNGQVNNGDVVYGGTANLTSVGIPNGQLVEGNPIDFTAAEQLYTDYSAQLASLAATGTTTVSTGEIELSGTNSDLNVFSLDGAALSAASRFTLSAPSESTVLINVTGSDVSAQNFQFSFNGIDNNHVLFNFTDATRLTLDGISFQGSAIAPYAELEFNNGNFEGNLITRAVRGFGEFHAEHFEGDDLPEPAESRVGVPEPTTIAGAGLALGLFGWTCRKRQQS